MLIFQFWNDIIDQTIFCHIAKCQLAFCGVTVNFVFEKLKSKHLVCLSFSGESKNLRGLRGFILQKVRAFDTFDVYFERSILIATWLDLNIE